jgi:hypothetical protein
MGVMLTYRFYRLDSGGHIEESPTVDEFESDRRAIQAAESLLDGKTFERLAAGADRHPAYPSRPQKREG